MTKPDSLSLVTLLICLLNCSPQAFAQDKADVLPSSYVLNEGPLMAERRQVLDKIVKAQSLGCGTRAYMTALSDLDHQSLNGGEPDKIRPRLDSLSRAVDDQLSRLRQLKDRPSPSLNFVKTDSAAPDASSPTAVTVPDAAPVKTQSVNMEVVRKMMKEQFPNKPVNMSDSELDRVIKQNPQLNKMWENMKGTETVR